MLCWKLYTSVYLLIFTSLLVRKSKSNTNLTYEYIIILFVTEISPLNSKQFNCTYNNYLINKSSDNVYKINNEFNFLGYIDIPIRIYPPKKSINDF